MNVLHCAVAVCGTPAETIYDGIALCESCMDIACEVPHPFKSGLALLAVLDEVVDEAPEALPIRPSIAFAFRVIADKLDPERTGMPASEAEADAIFAAEGAP